MATFGDGSADDDEDGEDSCETLRGVIERPATSEERTAMAAFSPAQLAELRREKSAPRVRVIDHAVSDRVIGNFDSRKEQAKGAGRDGMDVIAVATLSGPDHLMQRNALLRSEQLGGLTPQLFVDPAAARVFEHLRGRAGVTLGLRFQSTDGATTVHLYASWGGSAS